MNANTPSGRPDGPKAKAGKPISIFGNDNKALITLAVKCRLISLDQEPRLLAVLAEKRRQVPDFSAVDLFRETRVLSPDDIDFLFAVRDHLEMKMLDKKFGELGIANQLVAPESVKKALDIQNAIFKETNESKLIGDILLENKEITQADKSAILLTQDRIKDELLAEAMNDIAGSEIEKLSLNMRFGAIAVKKSYITIDQLNQALSVQEGEVRQGRPRRYLGNILKELFDLSDGDLGRILKIQKELEKKRLSLENALEKYNSETSINKRLARVFDYRFSKNKLQAFLGFARENYEEIRIGALKRWLNSIGITTGFCPDKEIYDFLAQNTPGQEICIAKGIPPDPGEDGRIEFYFDAGFDAGAGVQEDPDLLPMVKKGDALAQRIPARPGTPGQDVSGFPLAPPAPKEAALNCGEGVTRDEDLFIADQDGIALLYQNRTLFVKEKELSIPTRHYTGSIDADLGDSYKGVNLKIEGDILENGMVRCQGLEITGTVLGQVSASGDVLIKGHIGRMPESDKAWEPAKIKAEGDVKASKTISNAIVMTAKSLVAPNADLTATAVQAFQDITVKNILGSDLRSCVLQTGKAPSLKADSISALIRSRTKQLDELRCEGERQALEAWFKEKMDVKEAYLNQQEFLKFVLALVRFKPLSGLAAISDKLLAARKNPDKWPDLPPCPPEDAEGLARFTQTFIQATEGMTLEAVETYAREQADLKYGMYRAAVNAARRYQHEYEARKKQVEEKAQGREKEIQALEETIRKLTIRRDTFLLGQAYKSQPVPPAIRVKNRVTKGTVIKGRTAKITVDQDIYGVKFTEAEGADNGPVEILIEGFYD